MKEFFLWSYFSNMIAIRLLGLAPLHRILRNGAVMKTTYKTVFRGLRLIAFVLFTSASAQEISKGKPAATATPGTSKKIINLWPGVAPGSEQWRQPETAIGSAGNQRIMNVSIPTLTIYLPEPSIATGTSVIVAPGGGFVWLSIDSEGHDVAKWLVARGITAFVLKYRLFQVEGQAATQVEDSAKAALGDLMRDHSLIDKYG